MAEIRTEGLNINPAFGGRQPRPCGRRPSRKKKGPRQGPAITAAPGRRKSSVARVRIKPGGGKLLVNKKELNDYFKREQDRNAVVAPLKADRCGEAV